jgi:hypothetical protein
MSHLIIQIYQKHAFLLLKEAFCVHVCNAGLYGAQYLIIMSGIILGNIREKQIYKIPTGYH